MSQAHSVREHEPTICTPTLFIGLGGFGGEILSALRKRILEANWGDTAHSVRMGSLAEFPVAQFMQVDTDSHAYSTYPALNRTAERDEFCNQIALRPEELVINRADWNKYFISDNELAQYPHIQSWLPLSRKDWFRLNIDPSHGAGQIRALGRLYFYDKFDIIRQRIGEKLRRLASIESQNISERLESKHDGGVRIVVITSLFGGTGSGMFLDMGYLAQMMANDTGRRNNVDLVTLLPGSYQRFADFSDAIGYASLMELETLMTQDIKFVDAWEPGVPVDQLLKPYHDVYLCSTTNILGKRVSDVRDVYNMLADSLFEEFTGGQFSKRRRASVHLTLQHKVKGYTASIDSQFGKISLSYSSAYSASGQSDIGLIDPSQTDRTDNNHLAIPTPDIPNKTSANLLLEALHQYPDRNKLFEDCLRRAMPWIDADLSVINEPVRFHCFVGVSNAAVFEQVFGEEFRRALPPQAGFLADRIHFLESPTPGRLTCYIEYSGLPLTTLRQLRNWRASYDKNSNRMVPLHIHKDPTLFVHPLVPTHEELDQLTMDYQLFLRAIALGVLQSHKGTDKYVFMKRGNRFSVGSECTIRMDGVDASHRDEIKQQVATKLDKALIPYQLAGLAVLYEYYSQEVFKPHWIYSEDRVGRLSESLGYVLCKQLHDSVLKEFENKAKAQKLDAQNIIDRLSSDLDTWTEVIAGSKKDGYLHEVHEERQAKRVLRPEFFEAGWLDHLIDPASQTIVQPTTTTPGSMPPPLECWIAIDGQPVGPLDAKGLYIRIAQGTLTAQTLVWYQGMATWLPADQVPHVLALFGSMPPPLLAQ